MAYDQKYTLFPYPNTTPGLFFHLCRNHVIGRKKIAQHPGTAHKKPGRRFCGSPVTVLPITFQSNKALLPNLPVPDAYSLACGIWDR
jgi:hypothetical protein